MAAAESDGLVRVWDVAAGRAVAALAAAGPVAVSPDGAVLVTGAANGPALLLWPMAGADGPQK